MSHMNGEDWLLERLKVHGLDVYTDAREFDCLRDRLAYVIRENRYGPIVAGRHDRKPETYEEVFERIYGVKLKDVPRGTTHTKQSTTGRNS